MQSSPSPVLNDDVLADHRAELVAFCYRMLASPFDAQDATQETMARAWRRADTFDPVRGSVRTWLYAIASNVCLDQLRSRQRRYRAMDLVAPARPGDPMGEVAPPDRWVEPLPEPLMVGSADDPATIAERRDSVRLALVAAWQHLPARQRAVLILREVLGFSAAEVADQLAMSAQAVNSALQRARATLAARDLEETDAFDPADAAQRALLDRYLAAFEQQDFDTLAGMLRHDATMTMPPLLWWLEGRDDIAAVWRADPGACAGTRVFPTVASGHAAFAQYAWSDRHAGYEPRSITVIETSARQIVRLTVQLDTAVWLPAFGFPIDRLPSSDAR